jgi:hypothetical protein
MKSYSELRRLDTLQERYDYLKLNGSVGSTTFGSDRWVNQQFYTSAAWRQVRSAVITRDNGCDLGVPDHEIYKGLYIHHMNPLTLEQIRDGDDAILDPEFLITVKHNTHNAIHYGDDSLLSQGPVVRRPGDTKLW